VSRRLDRRLLVIPLAVAVTATGGYLLKAWSEQELPETSAPPAVAGGGHAVLGDDDARRAHERFQQGVAMLQAGQFEYAATAMHEVLAIYPALPEAHVNMGYALLGLGDEKAAADFFHSATDLRPSLHNAYYGLALAEMDAGNDRAALAAMQSFAHRADEGDRHLPRAQEIIWELQAKLRETGE
jgi:tetratricopeptide (TPR) repeat protein